MKPTYHLCDVCGRKVPPNTQLPIGTGEWQAGPDGSEERIELVDLCRPCLMGLACEFIDHPTTRKLNSMVALDWLKRHRKAAK